MHHHLKTEKQFYARVLEGTKTFEIRFNDRQYQAGDLVTLLEIEEGTRTPTGRELVREIGYVTSYAQMPDYVVFSLLGIDTDS